MAGREQTVSDEEILRFFTESEDPFLTTGEVAEFLDFSNQGTLKRLYRLEDAELIDSKRAGKVPGWWITEKGRRFLQGELDVDDVDDLVE